MLNPGAPNEQFNKLIFRVKATNALFFVRKFIADNLYEKAIRMNRIAKHYHTKAYEMGYKSVPFLKDLSEVEFFEKTFGTNAETFKKAA